MLRRSCCCGTCRQHALSHLESSACNCIPSCGRACAALPLQPVCLCLGLPGMLEGMGIVVNSSLVHPCDMAHMLCADMAHFVCVACSCKGRAWWQAGGVVCWCATGLVAWRCSCDKCCYLCGRFGVLGIQGRHSWLVFWVSVLLRAVLFTPRGFFGRPGNRNLVMGRAFAHVANVTHHAAGVGAARKGPAGMARSLDSRPELSVQESSCAWCYMCVRVSKCACFGC